MIQLVGLHPDPFLPTMFGIPAEIFVPLWLVLLSVMYLRFGKGT